MSNTEAQNQAPAIEPATKKTVRDIPSMLLPVQDKLLLVPGVSVAEIVNYSYPDCPQEAPEWFLGYIDWRKLTVPLVSFELLNEQAAPESDVTRRIAVLNNTGVSETIPFIAIVIKGIPSLLRIMPQHISVLDNVELSSAELAAVKLEGGETALIPDVSMLEKAYSEYLQAL